MREEPPEDWAASYLQSNVAFTLLLAVLLVVYFASERSILHVSRTLRRFYFLLLVALATYWLLSAVRQASDSRIELVMVFVIVLASVVEDKMERSLYLTPFSSQALEFVSGTPEAVGKAELLAEIVRSMTTWQGFSIGLAKQLAWLDGSLHKHQAAIHQVLEGADVGEINFILAHTNCPFLLEVAAEKTIDLLSSPSRRLNDLNVLSRAILLDGFQKLGLRHRSTRQQYARCILLNTLAQDLSALKAHLDDAPDHHTTFKLLYSDLQGSVQQEVLEHVRRQGQTALKQYSQQHPSSLAMTLKVVSDIDDTLLCSGGKFPAGSDVRLPRNCVYPGVLAFYRALDAAFAASHQGEEGEEEGEEEERSESPHVSSNPKAQSPAPASSPPSSSSTPPPEPARSRALNILKSPAESPPHRGVRRALASSLAHLRGGDLAAFSEKSPGGEPQTGHRFRRRFGRKRHSPEPEPETEGSPGFGLEAVMPSHGSLQSMVGLTLFTRSPEPSRIHSGLHTPLSRSRSLANSGPFLERRQQTSGHLVFLSARPESYKGFTEVLSFKRIFQPLVRSGELQGYPVLLLGSLRVGPTALYAYAADRRGKIGPASLQFYQALCHKKLARFKQFAAIYPECCWMFVGDNGQGDVLLAEHLVELLGDRLVACFLHQVVPLEETVTKLRKGHKVVPAEEAVAWPQRWQEQRIFIGPDYVSLATTAHEQGLLDDRGLHLVAAEARRDLQRVNARFAHADYDRAAAVEQLNESLAAANAALLPKLAVELLPAAKS